MTRELSVEFDLRMLTKISLRFGLELVCCCSTVTNKKD